MCKTTFTHRLHLLRPRLVFRKILTDLCNRCYELDIRIFSASSREDRARLIRAKCLHQKQALHQRVLMNALIRTASRALGLEEYHTKLLLPEIDDPLDESTKIENVVVPVEKKPMVNGLRFTIVFLLRDVIIFGICVPGSLLTLPLVWMLR